MVLPEPKERVAPVVRDPHVPRFPVIFKEPTVQQVTDNISQRDYTQWAVLGVSCFPSGYFIARYIDRRMAVRGMLFTGILGTIGGGLLAYQNSELRLQGFGRNDGEVARFLPHLSKQQTPSDQSSSE